MVGIIGCNGLGKSILLQIICGMFNLSVGLVEVKGCVVVLLELGFGFNLEYSGCENVFMNGQLLGFMCQQIEVCFKDIEVFVDIGDFMDQLVKVYFSGMYVCLVFVVIVYVDVDIFVIDEVLVVGDVFFIQKCMCFLCGFMKIGMVLFVSYDIVLIKNLCMYVVWIDWGYMCLVGELCYVCDLYLQEFYEVQQGKSVVVKVVWFSICVEGLSVDVWCDKINVSNLCNDLQVFIFDLEVVVLGSGGVVIIDVSFVGEDGECLNWVVGGEVVMFVISIMVVDFLCLLIVGFFVKDKLGQMLFGENIYFSYEFDLVLCVVGEQLQVCFEFCMLILFNGQYLINVVVVEGMQDEYV